MLVVLHDVDERQPFEERVDLALQQRVFRSIAGLQLEVELQVRHRCRHRRLDRDPPLARTRADDDQQLAGDVLGRLVRDPVAPVLVRAAFGQRAPPPQVLLPDGDRGVRELAPVLVGDRAVDPVSLLVHLPLLFACWRLPHRKRGAGDSTAAAVLARPLLARSAADYLTSTVPSKRASRAWRPSARGGRRSRTRCGQGLPTGPHGGPAKRPAVACTWMGNTPCPDLQ